MPIPCPSSLHPYTLPPSHFLSSRPHIRRILSSTILFRPSPPSSLKPPQALLLRRSPKDYFPFLWETPGGSLDADTDACILDAAVRELFEETGLTATRAVSCIAAKPKQGEQIEGYVVEDDGQVWTFPEPGTEWSWAKVTFLVEVKGTGQIILQEEEHVDYRWVQEEEVRESKFKSKGEEGQESIEFVSGAVRLALLEAFQIINARMSDGEPNGME